MELYQKIKFYEKIYPTKKQCKHHFDKPKGTINHMKLHMKKHISLNISDGVIFPTNNPNVYVSPVSTEVVVISISP